MTIRVKGREQLIQPRNVLPTQMFQLTHVRLGERPLLNDAGLVSFEGLTNLIDFGLSKGSEEQMPASRICGICRGLRHSGWTAPA